MHVAHTHTHTHTHTNRHTNSARHRGSRVVQACRQLGNYNGVMEIISALHLGAIQQLKKTWKEVRTHTHTRTHSSDSSPLAR